MGSTETWITHSQVHDKTGTHAGLQRSGTAFGYNRIDSRQRPNEGGSSLSISPVSNFKGQTDVNAFVEGLALFSQVDFLWWILTDMGWHSI